MGMIEHVQFTPRQSNNPESQTTTKKKSRKKWAEIDNYLIDVLIRSDDALDAALQSIQVAGLPAHSVSPNQGKLLMLLAQTVAARHILEIGTLGGYSTIWLARALAPKGRLITLEANPMHAKIALANVAHAGLADRVDLRLGAALELTANSRRRGAIRFHLYRRGQSERWKLFPMGAETLASGRSHCRG